MFLSLLLYVYFDIFSLKKDLLNLCRAPKNTSNEAYVGDVRIEVVVAARPRSPVHGLTPEGYSWIWCTIYRHRWPSSWFLRAQHKIW